MFGQNPIRKQELHPEGDLWVQEIFPTLQGEGPYAGEPAVFLRLAGCNLKCWFCDTDFESGTLHLSATALVTRLLRESKSYAISTKLVVITGGEPLRQNIVPLLRVMREYGLRAQIETAGTVWVPGLEALLSVSQQSHERDIDIVCSPKTGKVHEMIERYCLHYKYIVSTNFPVDWKRGVPMNATQRKLAPGVEKAPDLYYPTNERARVWVQPCDEGEEVQNKANRDLTARLAMKFGHRLSLQQHKVLQLP